MKMSKLGGGGRWDWCLGRGRAVTAPAMAQDQAAQPVRANRRRPGSARQKSRATVQTSTPAPGALGADD